MSTPSPKPASTSTSTPPALAPAAEGQEEAPNASDASSEEDGDVPLTMTASVLLDALPRDAHTALDHAAKRWDHPSTGQKVTVRFKAVGSAPILRTQVYKISASHRFETVVNFLRTRLKCPQGQAVFCYVNSVFAPGLDEGVGGLWRCFKTDEQLIVAYSMTPAFG